MNKLLVITAVLTLAILPMAGCLQNANDLKDRLSQNFVAGEKVESGVIPSPTKDAEKAIGKTNKTGENTTAPKRELKPPVARMEIYGGNGALVYQADFVAADYKEGAPVPLGEITLIATPSEAITPGAAIEKYEWKLNGNVLSTQRKATAILKDYGMHMVELIVTDSDGLKDTQMVHLVAPPEPFKVQIDLTGGLIFPLSGLPPASETHTLQIPKQIDGKPVKALDMVVELTTGALHDAVLTVTDPAGTSTTVDAASVGEPETLKLTSPAPGAYVITADTSIGIATEHAVKVTITYIEVVDGIEDGHGGHAH